MELGFNLRIDHCNTQVVICAICVMVMVIALFNCIKFISKKKTTKEKKSKEVKPIEQSRDDDNGGE